MLSSKERKRGLLAASIVAFGLNGSAPSDAQEKPVKQFSERTWAGEAANCILQGRTIDCAKEFPVKTK
ncbi:MAG: hypothetical protein RLZZ283_248 [Candidatus Parcubacteria bacterium]|jgi:hypothetical protein